MAIKNVKAVVDDALTSTALEMMRELAYQDLVNTITVEEKKLAEDILTLAQGMSMGDEKSASRVRTRARKQMKDFEEGLLEATKDALDITKVKKQAERLGFTVLDSKKEAYRYAGLNTNTNYCAIVKDGTKLTLIFVRSYKGNAAPGTQYFKTPGANLVRSIKFAATTKAKKYLEGTGKFKDEQLKNVTGAKLFQLHGNEQEGIQSTITLASSFNAFDKYVDKPDKLTRQVVEEYVAEFFAKYNVKMLRTASIGQLLQDLEMIQEIGSYDRNKSPIIIPADAPEMRKFNAEVAKKLIEKFGPKFESSRSMHAVLMEIADELMLGSVEEALTPQMKKRSGAPRKKKVGDKFKKSTQKQIRVGKTKKKVLSTKSPAKTSVKPGRVKGAQKTGPSPIALQALLDKHLSAKIKDKMIAPRLVNRTGRFAESARIQNVLIGPRGGINIAYTYDTERYGTFEPGGKQGSVHRDPRRIIGESIREIAVGLVGDKFMTLRRV